MWRPMLMTFIAFITVSSFVFYNGFFFERTSPFGGPAGHLANAIGVSVGIEENEYNSIAQQLQDRADELGEREKSLEELEREVLAEIRQQRREERRAFLATSIGGVFMFGLLSVNFFYDIAWRRQRRKN